jgi:hypothetical protein
MRKLVIAMGAVMAMSGAVVSGALAARNPAGTGQPGTAQTIGANCGVEPMQPPGFASGGFAHAGTVYANPGTTPGNQTHAISEYDIACYQFSTNH